MSFLQISSFTSALLQLSSQGQPRDTSPRTHTHMEHRTHRKHTHTQDRSLSLSPARAHTLTQLAHDYLATHSEKYMAKAHTHNQRRGTHGHV